MLHFQRALHTSRVCFQHAESVATVLPAKEDITAYLQYFKTPKDQRPLVYRKRNASELLSRDLWDPVAKKRIVPLDPPHVPSKLALSELFGSAQSVDELFEYRELMLQLATKPKYTTSYHINAFIEKSAELRKLPHALTYIYTQKNLKHILNADVTNTILAFLYINPRKSLANAISKASVAKSKIGHKNQITDLLEASIYHKNNSEIPQELQQQITSAEPLDLTRIQSETTDERSLQLQKYTYLQLSPIVKELSEEPSFKDLPNVLAAKKFVASFKQLQEKLDAKDQFNAIVSKSIFRKPRQPAAETAEATEA